MFQLYRTYANAPNTRMEMPAHLEALIHKPPRNPQFIAKTIERNARMEREQRRRKAIEKVEEARRRAMAADFMLHPYRANRLLELFSKVCLVDLKSLKSSNRCAKVAKARMCAMWMLRYQTQLGLVRIGGKLGGRDSSTVLHGIRKVEQTPELLEQARMWQREVLRLERLLYGAGD